LLTRVVVAIALRSPSSDMFTPRGSTILPLELGCFPIVYPTFWNMLPLGVNSVETITRLKTLLV